VSAASAARRHGSAWRAPLLYLAATVITLFMLIPIWLIFVAAFSPQLDVYSFPKPLLPVHFSTDTMSCFLNSTGVKPSFKNSVLVGMGTLVLALLLGAPAGYAVARFSFPGRNLLQLVILATRSFPVLVLSIPLAVSFISWSLYDTVKGVALVHTAMALPTTILVTSSIFVGVSRELEEAAQTLGCNRIQAFIKVALPLALPGLAASAIFTLVLSWNEVLAATILTLHNRKLPALGLTHSAHADAPLPFRYAGGLFLVVLALVFIFFMRKYLLGMWGQVVK